MLPTVRASRRCDSRIIGAFFCAAGISRVLAASSKMQSAALSELSSRPEQRLHFVKSPRTTFDSDTNCHLNHFPHFFERPRQGLASLPGCLRDPTLRLAI